MIPERIEATATITRVLAERTAHGTLPNGKAVFLYVDRDDPAPQLAPGTTVSVRLSPADFSRARIMTIGAPCGPGL
jgi:translation initiation factor IF-1